MRRQRSTNSRPTASRRSPHPDARASSCAAYPSRNSPPWPNLASSSSWPQKPARENPCRNECNGRPFFAAHSTRPASSEGESQGELHNSGIAGQRCNLAEAAGVEVVRRKPKLRGIERVEGLPAEFEAAAF